MDAMKTLFLWLVSLLDKALDRLDQLAPNVRNQDDFDALPFRIKARCIGLVCLSVPVAIAMWCLYIVRPSLKQLL